MAPEPPQEEIDAFVATLGEQDASDPVVDEQAPDPAPVDVPEVEAGTTEDDTPDSFRGFDETLLAVVDPALRAALEAERKSIQGDATRKYQEAAKLRDQFEGIDLELAKNAVTYMERLSEPEFLIEAHSAMSAELERLGLTKAQADRQATNVIEEQLADDDDYELETGSPDPRTQSKLQELEARIAAQDAREAERDQEARLSYLANETLKQETLLRRDNPEWDDADFVNIYTMAPGLKGNLLTAADVYRKQEAHFAKRLLKSKSSVPNSITPPPSSGSSAEAKKPFTLEEGHKAAMEALRNMQAND